MRILSLFSGIGAHDLGLERAGMTIAGQCECDPWCLAVLGKHWPKVPRFDDVRALTGELVAQVCGRVDLVTGGFPCTDISLAGKGAGLAGQHSGLWHEMRRIVSEVRPAWVLAENVPALRTRGADEVLEGLEALGYACWPLVVGAEDAGAPHRRRRVWIVAHTDSDALRLVEQRVSGGWARGVRDEGKAELGADGVADATELRCDRDRAVAGGEGEGEGEGRMLESARGSQGLAYADRRGREQLGSVRLLDGEREASRYDPDGRYRWPSRPGEPQAEWEAPRVVESGICGAATGTPDRLVGFARRNRIRALGNCNPPQVVELIGRAILEEAA